MVSMNVDVLNIEGRKILYIKNKTEKYIKLLNIKNIEDIVVKFVKRIPKCTKDVMGMYDLEYVTRPNKKPSNKHIVYIRKDLITNRYALLTTLMHELVHLKQYATGKMNWVRYQLRSENIFIFWKKKRMGEFCDLDYYSSPWEIEAREVAKKMWREGKL